MNKKELRSIPSDGCCVVFRFCGDHPDGSLTETSRTNKMTVQFFSDGSYVDIGFDAGYEAVDVTDRKQQ